MSNRFEYLMSSWLDLTSFSPSVAVAERLGERNLCWLSKLFLFKWGREKWGKVNLKISIQSFRLSPVIIYDAIKSSSKWNSQVPFRRPAPRYHARRAHSTFLRPTRVVLVTGNYSWTTATLQTVLLRRLPVMLRLLLARAVARHIWYVQVLWRDAEIGCRDVMDHVAASTLAAVVVASRLITFAIRGTIVVNQNAILELMLLMAHISAWNDVMHVLVQVIVVEMIMMMGECTIRRNIWSWEIAVMMMVG